MTKKIDEDDYKYTKEIVCPYCGCIFMDSWELSGDKGDGAIIKTDCQVCEKRFEVQVNLDITYSSIKEE